MCMYVIFFGQLERAQFVSITVQFYAFPLFQSDAYCVFLSVCVYVLDCPVLIHTNNNNSNS